MDVCCSTIRRTGSVCRTVILRSLFSQERKHVVLRVLADDETLEHQRACPSDHGRCHRRLFFISPTSPHSRALGSPMISFQAPSDWRRRTSIALLRIATVFPDSSTVVPSKSVYN